MSDHIQHFGGEVDGPRDWRQAVSRGLKKRCPQCGRGSLFKGYSKPAQTCDVCGLDFTGHQADDAPPYVTIMLVGHIAIPLALAMEEIVDPPIWVQFALWAPLMLAASMLLLPISKGGLIGLQWANRMHGFADPAEKQAF